MTFRSGPLWRKAYEVDFTALAGQNIKTGGDGNKTIDGLTWLWGNNANLTSCDIVPGTGIVMVASTANTGYYEGANVRSAPNLTIPVASVATQFDITVNVLRVLVRMTLTNADTAAEGGKVFLEYVTTPKDQNFSILKAFSSGFLGFQTNSSTDPTYETVYAFNGAASTDDVLGFAFWPPKAFQCYTGAYIAGERMRFQNQRGAIFQNIASQPIRKTADARVGFCQITNNATGTLTTTFTHMRVDVHDRQPAL